MEEQAFINAIIADPDDDAPRLLYAEWLEEQVQEEFVECPTCGGSGNLPWDRERTFNSHCVVCRGMGRRRDPRLDRSELIKVQITLTQWKPTSFPPEGDEQYNRLCKRESILLWDLSYGIDLALSRMVYRRGMVEKIILPGLTWVARAEELIKKYPLREVEFTSFPRMTLGEVHWYNHRPRGGMRSKFTAHWTTLLDGENIALNCNVTQAFDKRDLFSSKQTYRELMQPEVDRARTPAGYCKTRWPGIRFTVIEEVQGWRWEERGANSQHFRVFEIRNLPLPMTHRDFEVTARQLEDSVVLGTQPTYAQFVHEDVRRPE